MPEKQGIEQMKKFNLIKEIIVAKKSDLLQAMSSSKSFGISINGNICYEPFGSKDILIFQTKGTNKESNISIESLFGKNYQVVEDNERVLIKAFSNWQEIINYNILRASYDDTTADGVDEFSNKEAEEIGWHATEFNIKYRDLVDILEAKCDGTLICIEYEEPYRFSGLGFLDNDDTAKEILFDYCQAEIKRVTNEDDDYQKENLSSDELHAAEFFKIFD